MYPLGILSLASQAPNAPPDLSFLAYLDVWIIGGLVLLAVVVVIGKWIWGQWRRRNEVNQQGYYDGYDPYYDQEPDLDGWHDDEDHRDRNK